MIVDLMQYLLFAMVCDIIFVTMESKLPLMPDSQVLARDFMKDLPTTENRAYYVSPKTGTLRGDKYKKPVICTHDLATDRLTVKPKVTKMMWRVAEAGSLLMSTDSVDRPSRREQPPIQGAKYIGNMTDSQRLELAEKNIMSLKEGGGEQRPDDLLLELINLVQYIPNLEGEIAYHVAKFIDTSADSEKNENALDSLYEKAGIVSKITPRLFDNHPELIDKSLAVIAGFAQRSSIYERAYAMRPMRNLVHSAPKDMKADMNYRLAEIIRGVIDVSDDRFDEEANFHSFMRVRPNQAVTIAYAASRLEGSRAEELQGILHHTVLGAISSRALSDTVNCAATMIEYLRKSDRASVIKSIFSLDGPYDQARAKAASLIKLADDNEVQELMKLAGLDDEGFGRSTLDARASELDEIHYFDKTGSSTYILPRQYHASMRIVPAVSARVWAEVFYNWDVWREAGFNYVPVEPIEDIDFYHQRWSGGVVKELSAVVTTNLSGRSLNDWIKYREEFIDELIELRGEIITTLESMQVNHGHLHRGNFVVVPYKTPDGKVDYSRCPRLYVIDFDQASKANNS